MAPKTTTEKPPRKAAHAAETASAEALEQASEYGSLFAPVPLELEGDEPLMVPPHPDYGLLADEQLEAYDELNFAVDKLYDREEDIYIPEQRIRDKDGIETGVVLPATTRRGAHKFPYQQGGELVKPPHRIRIVQIALGDDGYKRLREGGKNASDVFKIWNEQSLRIQERQQRDSKSAGSAVGVAAVPAADSE
jgi:hypothetical protein